MAASRALRGGGTARGRDEARAAPAGGGLDAMSSASARRRRGSAMAREGAHGAGRGPCSSRATCPYTRQRIQRYAPDSCMPRWAGRAALSYRPQRPMGNLIRNFFVHECQPAATGASWPSRRSRQPQQPPRSTMATPTPTLAEKLDKIKSPGLQSQKRVSPPPRPSRPRPAMRRAC